MLIDVIGYTPSFTFGQLRGWHYELKYRLVCFISWRMSVINICLLCITLK